MTQLKLKGFTQENHPMLPNFLKLLIQWAALLRDSKLAKVVFVVDGSWAVSFFQEVLKARPELLDEQVWGDVPEPIVRTWLHNFLEEKKEKENYGSTTC